MEDGLLLLMLLFMGVMFFTSYHARKVRMWQIAQPSRAHNGMLIVLSLVEVLCDVGFIIIVARSNGGSFLLGFWALLLAMDVYFFVQHQRRLSKLLKNAPA